MTSTTETGRENMAGRQYGRMKNRLLIFILTLVMLMASGCKKEPVAPMRIGTNTWPGYEPMYLAADLGFYNGARVRPVRFDSATDVLAAFGKKEIEAAALTLDEVMSLTQFEKGISIILVADISDGADVIIGHEEINNLEGLKGRRIGAETTAVGIYMLHRALEKAGLAEKEVKVVNLNQDEHEAAFSSGKVDAVVTFEPVRTRLLAKGGRILFDSGRIPGEIVDVVVVRKDYLRRRPDAVKEFLAGWFRSLAFLKERPSEGAERMKVKLKLSAEEVIDSYKRLRLPDREENKRLLTWERPALAETAKRLEAVMIEKRLIYKHVDIEALVEHRMLEELYR